MLPDIVDVAEQHKLEMNTRTRNNKEVLFKCPFCYEDSKPDKKRRYYLSLNSHYQIFKCWFCGESGGVFRFISLLEDKPEREIKQRYRKRKISHLHKAEKLTRNQKVKLAEFLGNEKLQEPDWRMMRERDPSYYQRTLDLLWKEWQAFLENEKREAYFWLIHGLMYKQYQQAIARIRKREKEIESPLLDHVLQIYSCASRPKWTEDTEKFVRIFKYSVSPEPVEAGMKLEDKR